MYDQNSGGVDLRKAVYALKCPVCGAECRSKESGECPYCGAYLDFSGSAPGQAAPQNMQYTQNAQNMQYYGQPQPYSPIDPALSSKMLLAWKKKRLISWIIYTVVAAVSIIGLTFLNEGDPGFNPIMLICVLVYLPYSFVQPIVLPMMRPDGCYPPELKPAPKLLSWFLYTLAEFGVMILLTVIAIGIKGE